MNQIQKYQVNNTFNRRPIPNQIIAYIIVILDFLVFSTCILPNLQSLSLQIGIGTVFMLSFAVVVSSGLVASCTDSSDILIRSNTVNLMKSIEDNNHLYCQKCRSIVQQTSRHCKICNICIQEFDHHCIWLNTCIGKNNYRSFIVLILSIAINFSVYIAGMVVLWKEDGWQGFMAAMVAVWSLSVIVAVIQILVLSLLCFHIFLIGKGMTTYDYLVSGSGKKIIPENMNNRDRDCSIAKNNTFDSFVVDHNHNNHEQMGDLPVLNLFKNDQNQQGKGEKHQKYENRKKSQMSSQKVQKIDEAQGQSEKDTEEELQIRRNKSLSYFLGQFQVELQMGKQFAQIIDVRSCKVKSSVQLRQNKQLKSVKIFTRQP